MKYIFLNALCSIAILVYQSVNKAAKKSASFFPACLQTLSDPWVTKFLNLKTA